MKGGERLIKIFARKGSIPFRAFLILDKIINVWYNYTTRREKMKTTNEQIEKAVTWWADQVAKPTFSALSDEERAQPENRAMQFAEFLAGMSVEPVTQGKREKFIKALRSEIKLNEKTTHWGIILSVDYGPCMMLRDAAKSAGISEDNFPWKTTMWIMEDGRVLVRLGYDGKEQEL